MELDGLTILITGAASGIGRAIASKAIKENAAVILLDRNKEALDLLQIELGEQHSTSYACDLTDESSFAAAVESIKKSGVKIDGIVHCAGIHWLKPVQLTSDAALDEMLHSHVNSAFSLIRSSVQHKLLNDKGCSIVLLSSAAAIKGGSGAAAYSAAKGALISATRVFAVELARKHIRVNALAPGVVKTPQSAAFLSRLLPEQVSLIEKSHPLGLGEPEDIAEAASFLLSPRARWITGTTIAIDGGFSCQ